MRNGIRGRRLVVAGVVALVVALAGCGDKGDGSEEVSQAPASAAPVAQAGPRVLTDIAHAAPLSEALPADAIAYLRVPSVYDWLLAPRRDGLNELKAGAAHREIADALLGGIENNLLNLFDDPAAGIAGNLMADVRGPIEVVAFSSGQGIPVPGVLIRTTLAGYDRASFATLLETLTAAGGVALVGPLDDEGHALINAGLPLFVHFEESTGTLFMLSGTDANRTSLDNYRTGQYQKNGKLAAFEETIDDTGRHLAVWIDIQRWWPLLSMTQPPEQQEQLKMLGLDQAQSLWAGLSSRNGRAAAIVRLEMPRVGMRHFLPPVRPMGAVDVAGDVSWAARVALPTREDIDGLVRWLDSLGTGARAEFDEFLLAAREYLGVDPMSLFQAYGPDLLLVSDSAGFYSAYGESDRIASEAWEKVFLDRGWATRLDRTMGGAAMTEYQISGTAFIDQELVAELPEPFNLLLPRLGGRSFTLQEGPYVLTASVPQILADRAARGKRPLAQWLEGHDVSWNNALVAMLSESENAPRDVYHAYLQVLSFVASSVEVDLDLTRFPTAPDLGMPRAGRFGFQLDTGVDYVEGRFLYETTPLEALLNTNIVTWYVAGIVAAVAIPAYQDYQTRAAGGGGGPDSCVYAHDGMCDEPDLCPAGTDTTDCGGSSGAASCPFVNDGECDEPDVCPPGTDVADCGSGGGGAGGPDSCIFANDGECDEPANCAVGTDTTDCSGGGGAAGPDSCPFANDGECDEPINCSIGTDTTDCEAFPLGPDSCPWANDGECDEPDSCRVGTDTTDCAVTDGREA